MQAMAGDSNPAPSRPGIRPPPLLFQFPTLSPQPIWSMHPQHHMGAASTAMFPPQSLDFQQMPLPQQRFMPMPQQYHHLQQQQQRNPGGFCGNLNLQRAPDLNTPPPVHHLAFNQNSQQTVFLDQSTLRKEIASSSFTAVLAPPHPHPPSPSPSPSPPPPPPRIDLQQQRRLDRCELQQQQLDRSELQQRFSSSKSQARLPKGSEQRRPTQTSSEKSVRSEQGSYPPPLAAHRDIVADETLFLGTLSKFYEAMATPPFRLPRFHDKEFEIHRLYCQVTGLGGMLKVTRDKRWKAIATAFDLPPSVTNPIFFLRKTYEKVLHHYEQVYFHRKQGPHIDPPGALPMPVPVSQVEENDETLTTKVRGKVDAIADHEDSSSSHIVTGVIEGKFDNGYFVTVVVGSERLRGVIYSVPEEEAQKQRRVADTKRNAVQDPKLLDPPDKKVGGNARPKRKKRKRKTVKKDPDGIKSVRNGYNFFVAEQRQKLKGGRDEMSKIIGELWSNLSEEEKLPYREMSRKDRERYNREVEEKRQREVRASDSHLESELEDDHQHQQTDDSRGTDQMNTQAFPFPRDSGISQLNREQRKQVNAAPDKLENQRRQQL